VCVPKILDVLREPRAARVPRVETPPPAGASIPARGGNTAAVHRALGAQVLGVRRRRRPTAADLEEFWRRYGLRGAFKDTGLTETGTDRHAEPSVPTEQGLRSGRRSAGWKSAIADDGEILVRGENVTSGYFASSEAGATPAESPVDAEGWLHTGDIGDRDEAGRVFIKGRKKEMIGRRKDSTSFRRTSSAC
jgi:long-chain acyl-CoA synthetase